MSRDSRRWSLFRSWSIRPTALASLLLCTFAVSCAHVTPPPAPQPPAQGLISRVTAAKTVFLSNAGGNDYFNGEISGGPNVAYNELFSSLQQWGYFRLVDSPAHADLIFQVRGVEEMPALQNAAEGRVSARQFPPRVEVTILDPRSSNGAASSTNPTSPIPIDTISVLAGRGTDVAKGDIAFAQSMEWLTYQIGKLVNLSPRPSGKLNLPSTFRPSFETLLRSVGPVPPQVLDARNVFVEDDSFPRDPYYKGFLSALKSWGHYHLVGSAKDADVVLHFHDEATNGIFVTITPPNSYVILWTITDPQYGFYHEVGKRRTTALDENLVNGLKQLISTPPAHRRDFLTPQAAASGKTGQAVN